MNWSDLVRALKAISPAVVIPIITEWLDLFAIAGFAHPDFLEETKAMALGIGTVTVIVMYIFLKDASERYIKLILKRSFTLFLVLALMCLLNNVALGFIRTPVAIENFIDYWAVVFFFFLMSIPITIMLCAMALISAGENRGTPPRQPG